MTPLRLVETWLHSAGSFNVAFAKLLWPFVKSVMTIYNVLASKVAAVMCVMVFDCFAF